MNHRYITTTSLTAIGFNNADNGTEFISCLGRIVWGHPLKPQDKEKDGQKVLDSNGQPVKQWAFGVAFPKADFERDMWPHLASEAAKMYPQGVPQNFTYKYKDGDTDTDAKGNPLSGKPGYAGCYIIAYSTELQPPQCFVFENNAYRQIDENSIKTGDFVMVGTNVKAHGPNPNHRGSRPGLYINPMTVLLCFQGEAISGSYQADPNAMFGAAPPQVSMPQGAAPVGAPEPGGSTGPDGAGAPIPGGGMPSGPGNGAPHAPATATPAPSPSNPPAPPSSPAPSGPQRPSDPQHIHDNGNGTEQWFVNGAWDGGAHPAQAATPAAPAAPGGGMPPPATGFVDQAAGGAPAAPGGGMPGSMPPR